MANSVHNGHRSRMKKRFLQNGLDIFEPHQVLEMLLFYVIPRRDTNPIAHTLLDRFGGLSDVLDADYEHLCQIEGVSKQTALFLTFCGDLVGQYMESKVKNDQFFRDAEELSKFLQAKFFNETTEKFRLVCLNNRGKLLHCAVLSEGSSSTTALNLRLIIQTVINFPGTTGVVLAHNHPSGSTIPSAGDLDCTAQVKLALSSLGIRLLDHLIFAKDDYLSMRKTPKYASAFTSVPKETIPANWLLES